MRSQDLAEMESIEDRLSSLPSSVALDEALVGEFRRRRARIHQRHNEWRRGMPAIDELFDDDEQRAKALAGSLATELERTLELHGEMAADLGALSEWPRNFAEEWSTEASGLAECWGWGDEAREMFDVVLADLSEHAVRRAEAGERPRSGRAEVRVSRFRRVRIMAARTLTRFFRPPPAGR